MRILFFLLMLNMLPSPAQAGGWDCYARCMQGGNKFPAQCNDQCKEHASKTGSAISVPLSSPSGAVFDDLSIADDAQPTDSAGKRSFSRVPSPSTSSRLADPSCFNQCVARGGDLDSCDKKCSGGTKGFLRRDEKEYDKYGDGAEETDFSRVDFDCFKQCRLSGDKLGTCRLVCAK